MYHIELLNSRASRLLCFCLPLFFLPYFLSAEAIPSSEKMLSEKPLLVVLFGPPASGHGTIAIKISKTLSLPYLSSAALCREYQTKDSELGRRVHEEINSTSSISNELIFELFFDKIKRQDSSEGFLLYGLPQTVEQAKKMKEELSEGYQFIAVVIQLPEETIIQRCEGRLFCQQCGRIYHRKLSPPKAEGICDFCEVPLVQRSNDTLEQVQKRLNNYHQRSQPILEYYKKEGVLIEVSGDVPLEEMSEAIKKRLRPYLKP